VKASTTDEVHRSLWGTDGAPTRALELAPDAHSRVEHGPVQRRPHVSRPAPAEAWRWQEEGVRMRLADAVQVFAVHPEARRARRPLCGTLSRRISTRPLGLRQWEDGTVAQ